MPEYQVAVSLEECVQITIKADTAEKAEKLNGRTAMVGFVAAVISYAFSGSVFFFGVFGF